MGRSLAKYFNPCLIGNGLWEHQLKGVCVFGCGRGAVIQQCSTEGEGCAWSWAWTPGKPYPRGSSGCFLPPLPKGPLCQDLCRTEPVTAKSLDARGGPCVCWACCCFIAWWIWALLFPLQRSTIPTKCFTLLSVKNLLFFQIFYKFIHPRKPDIPYFILLRGCHCEGCGFTCNWPLLALISLTATNCKWRTNERNIYKFHGNSGGA